MESGTSHGNVYETRRPVVGMLLGGERDLPLKVAFDVEGGGHALQQANDLGIESAGVRDQTEMLAALLRAMRYLHERQGLADHIRLAAAAAVRDLLQNAVEFGRNLKIQANFSCHVTVSLPPCGKTAGQAPDLPDNLRLRVAPACCRRQALLVPQELQFLRCTLCATRTPGLQY